MELLTKRSLGYPLNEPFHEDSKRIHVNDALCEYVLGACMWIPRSILNIKCLEPVPSKSSLAPGKPIPLKLWVQHPRNPEFIGVPRFFGMSAFGKGRDVRTDGKDIRTLWNPAYTLREEQEYGIRNTLKTLEVWGGAFFIADCGMGKSLCMASLIQHVQKRTMIIVPRVTLLHQMHTDLGVGSEDKPPYLFETSLGILQGSWDKCSSNLQTCSIVIASLDSLSLFQYPQEFWATFGLVIFDEAHHMAAKTLSAILPHIPTRRIVGFSATPDRPDGLQHVLYWLLGPTSFVYERRPEITGKYETVHIKKIPGIMAEESFTFQGKLAFQAMLTQMASNEARNTMICNVLKGIRKERKKILFITAFRSHVDALYDLLYEEFKEPIRKIVGGSKCEDKGEHIVVATYSMLEEGFDDKDLDTLILCTPRSHIQQTVGRIERQKEGKLVPLVYDIVDQNRIFESMWKKRLSFYQSRGFKI